MSTYNPKQMVIDALVLATPPAHSGLKSFVSEEGVIALATELETALDMVSYAEGQDKKIAELEDTIQTQADDIEDLKKITKEFAEKVERL